ncbi:MAG: hypothetical protein RBU23_12990 [Candidatus Auribacterota bacterium]|jgi:hypothetical protein|nr:hypothetical protein [Candidatus Auribacterota bacterium]
MSILFTGESKIFEIAIRDINGNLIPPSGLLDVRVYLYHQVNKKVFAKFSKTETEGYDQVEITGDNKIRVVLDPDKTKQASLGRSIVQINLFVYDERYKDNTRVSIHKGILTEVKEAKYE